jgi:chromosome segregation protein
MDDRESIKLSISQIIQRLEEIRQDLEETEKFKNLEEIKNKNKDLRKKLVDLIREIKKPEEETAPSSSLLKNLEEVERSLERVNENLKKIQEDISSFSQREAERRKEFFDLQRECQVKQSELNEINSQLNEIKIELARGETRKEDLDREIEEEGIRELVSNNKVQVLDFDRGEIRGRIHKLKHQLELIGGIDPGVAEEYKEVKERHEFLENQSKDLKEAIKSLEKVISQLEETIKKQFSAAFQRINIEFEKYFKILFNGGRAKLVLQKKEPDQVLKEDQGEIDLFSKRDKVEYSGVEIQVSPPGKRLKSINMLSGGERALTSIALICAILNYNPSPFVVLDEVDAALDEANSYKFAEILEDLSRKTQFIIITHNRATMEKAKILYGVTMGDDGMSRLLSIKLEDLD